MVVKKPENYKELNNYTLEANFKENRLLLKPNLCYDD